MNKTTKTTTGLRHKSSGALPQQKTRAEVASTWVGPRSICRCGQTGDGTDSDHNGLFGHGPSMDGKCPKFQWAKFLPAFHTAITNASEE